MRLKPLKNQMPKEFGELMSVILRPDGLITEDALENFALQILRQRVPVFARIVLPLDVIYAAIGRVETKASIWSDSLGKEVNDRRQKPNLYHTILVPLATINAAREGKIIESNKMLLEKIIDQEEADEIQVRAHEDYRNGTKILYLFFRRVLLNHEDLRNKPWKEFYADWRVRNSFRELEEHLQWAPLPFLEEHYARPNTFIRKRENEIEVHEVDRDDTAFGDEISVTVFDTAGKELREETLFSVGRYRFDRSRDAGLTRDGEGAAADSVEMAMVPPDAVKRLFEDWKPGFEVVWHEDGSIELNGPTGRFDLYRRRQFWRWDPVSNSFSREGRDLESRKLKEAEQRDRRIEMDEGREEGENGEFTWPRAPRNQGSGTSAREPLDLDGARARLLEHFDGWNATWSGDNVVELSRRRESNTHGDYSWRKFYYDPNIGDFKLIDHDDRTYMLRGQKRSDLTEQEREFARHELGEPKQRIPPRVRTGLPEIFDPTSSKYDMPASIVRRLELYQEARREEAVPVPGSKQWPAGRSLLTAAERHDTAKAGMRVPIAERHPPSRQERYDKLGAHYAAMLRRAEGSGLEDAVQKDFVAAFIAASVDQDQRDRERDWAEQTKNDPEIGGKNLKRALKDAAYALDRFGDWELYGYLDDSGLGNHPDVIRLFSKAGAYARNQRAPEPPPPLEAGWEKRKQPRRLQWHIPNKVA